MDMEEQGKARPSLGEEYRWALTRQDEAGTLLPKELIGEDYRRMLSVQIMVTVTMTNKGFWAYGTTIQTLIGNGGQNGSPVRYKRVSKETEITILPESGEFEGLRQLTALKGMTDTLMSY